jgi:hypothetical protein
MTVHDEEVDCMYSETNFHLLRQIREWYQNLRVRNQWESFIEFDRSGKWSSRAFSVKRIWMFCKKLSQHRVKFSRHEISAQPWKDAVEKHESEVTAVFFKKCGMVQERFARQSSFSLKFRMESEIICRGRVICPQFEWCEASPFQEVTTKGDLVKEKRLICQSQTALESFFS